MRHYVLLLPLALLLCVPNAHAATPEQTLREGTGKLQGLIGRNHAEYAADSARYYAMVDKTMLPYFDLQRIGKVTLGPRWSAATADQRRRLTATFKNSMIHSYADAMLANQDSARVQWADNDAAPRGSDAIVTATLIRKNNQPVELEFSMGQSSGQWKIYDVALDGVSLAAGLRAQFKSEIARSGFEGLIQRLESNASLD